MKITLNISGKPKSYKLESEKVVFRGKKIGNIVDLGEIKTEFAGIKGEIRGGTDRDGFPMVPYLTSIARKKLFLDRGPGFRPKKKGDRRRKTIRGNTIGEDIVQLNIKVLEGGGKLESILSKKEGKEGEVKKEKAEQKPGEKNKERKEKAKPGEKK